MKNRRTPSVSYPSLRASLGFVLAASSAALFAACGGDDTNAASTSSGATSGGGSDATATSSGTGGAGQGGSGGSGSTSSQGGGSTSSQGGGGEAGVGGSGGAGGGGGCVPDEVVSCYAGPAGTDGVGICVSGSQTCASDGSAFGPCTGEVLPAAEICGNSIDEDCSGGDLSCGGTFSWNKVFGDAQQQRAFGIGADSGGGVALTGSIDGTVDFGGGGLTTATTSNIFLAKLDQNGGHVFSATWGTSGQHEGSDLAIDSTDAMVLSGRTGGAIDFGGGTLTPAGMNDVFVAKFSSAGAHVWSASYGDASDQAASGVAVDSTDAVLFAGRLGGSANFGGGNLTSVGGRDVFVAKVSSAGVYQWANRYGSALDDQANDVAADGQDNVIVVGQFRSAVNFGGGNLTSAGNGDVFVAKYTSAGAYVWSKAFGDASDQVASGVAADAAGNVYVTGTFQGQIDFGGGAMTSAGNDDVFVAKLDAAGNMVWQMQIGDAATDYVKMIAIDGSGNVGLTGFYQGNVGFGLPAAAGNNNAYIIKFDPNGTMLWAHGGGDTSSQAGSSVGFDMTGNLFAAGQLIGSMDLGGGALTSAGLNDIYVVKYSP